MTVEEAIQKANDGDVESMINLAGYYYHNDDLDNATGWFQKAADCGDPYATFQFIILIDLKAAINMAHAATRSNATELWEDALTYCNLGISYCSKLVDTSKPQNVAFLSQKYSDGQTAMEDLHNNFNTLSFRKAQCLLELSHYDDVIDYTDDETAPKFMMLRALAISGKDYPDAREGLQAFETASKYWQSVFDADYTPSDDPVEQLEFARSVFIHSYNIRAGLFGSANVNAAYQLILTQSQKVKEPNAKSLLEKDIAHYQIKKGLFGTTITYVD